MPSESELVVRLQALVDERQNERDEAAQARDESLARAARFQATLTQTILQALALRGVALDPRQTARVLSEDDPATLATWSQRVFTVTEGAAFFAD